MRDPALSLRSFEDGRRVVAALDRLGETAVDQRLRPLLEEVDIVGVVHHIDGAGARWPRADLSKDHFAVVAPVPLHVREPVAESERAQHVAAHGAAARELGRVDVTHNHGHRADPFQLARDQRSRPVPRDVVEEHLAARADGVVRELRRLDEFLDTHLVHPHELGDDFVERRRIVDTIRIGRSCAGDGFDDDRVADSSHRFPDLDCSGAPVVMRRANSRGVEDLLHPLLVAEGDGLLDRHAGDAERLTNACGEHHGRLPQRCDVVDVDPGGALHHVVDDRVLVGE